jgi:hypothetical protein
VSRAATGDKAKIVKIKNKQTGTVVAEMHVWVVWAECDPKEAESRFSELIQSPSSHLLSSGFHVINDATKVYRFTFVIEPKAIFGSQNDNEIPDLKEAATAPVPGTGKSYFVGGGDGDSALYKWDITRRVSIVMKNPGGIPKASLLVEYPAKVCEGQPAAQTNPVQFPTDDPDAEGNDDPLSAAQETNPYEVSSNPILPHGVGEIVSADAPGHFALDSWGAESRRFAIEDKFEEFARVQLWDGARSTGRFWFRISDPTKGRFHHYFKTKWSSSSPAYWTDDPDNKSESKLAH